MSMKSYSKLQNHPHTCMCRCHLPFSLIKLLSSFGHHVLKWSLSWFVINCWVLLVVINADISQYVTCFVTYYVVICHCYNFVSVFSIVMLTGSVVW